MSNNSSLLPPNASRLERNVAQLSVAVTNLRLGKLAAPVANRCHVSP